MNILYKFKAIPKRETFYNEETCFGVYSFETSDEIPHKSGQYILAGQIQRLTIGVEYEITATYEYSKKYGKYNYIPKTATFVKPRGQEQQEIFLRTQTTERQAENILAVYPNVIEDIISGKKIDYSKIKGIGKITWEKIEQKILSNYVLSDILALLQPLGITVSAIENLLNYESNPVLLKQKIIENPYIITKASGVGFRRADDIALKINPDILVSEYRLKAFLKWYLSEVANSTGDTWVTEEKLDKVVNENISECHDLYRDFLAKQKNNGTMIIIHEDKIGLRHLFDMEFSSLKFLDELVSAKFNHSYDIIKGILAAEKSQGFPYTTEQKEVIEKCCENNVVFITGQAGTGKSTILRGLVNIYNNCKIKCCALSAKAAQRVAEVTGHEASTIHRLLGFKGKDFDFNEFKPLDCDVLILDEASMINSSIFHALLCAVRKGTRVVICGDDEQLPPIGSGNIFHDLLKSKRYTCCNLVKILRQAERSGIISDSQIIRQNHSPVNPSQQTIVTGELKDMAYIFKDNREKMREIAVNNFLRMTKVYKNEDTVILVPCKKNHGNCTDEINKIIQDELISQKVPSIVFGNKEFRLGAKIIQRTNNYEKNVFNGEQGRVAYINKETQELTAEFSGGKKVEYTRSELKSLELAYALTVHVTQGSGYDNVIILIDNTHYKLLDSCLLYTAITRAKKRCLLISEPKAYKVCIHNKASKRNTWLNSDLK